MSGTVDLQILQNDSKNNPSVSASRSHAPGIRKRIPPQGSLFIVLCDSDLWSHSVDPQRGAGQRFIKIAEPAYGISQMQVPPVKLYLY